MPIINLSAMVKKSKDEEEAKKILETTDPYYAHKAGKTIETAKPAQQAAAAEPARQAQNAKTQGVLNAINQGITAGAQKTAAAKIQSKAEDPYYKHKAEAQAQTKKAVTESLSSGLKSGARKAFEKPDFNTYAERGRRKEEAEQAERNKNRFGVSFNTTGNPWADTFDVQRRDKYFTEDEQNQYYYLLGRYGRKEADDYAKSLERETNARRAETEYEAVKDLSARYKPLGVGLNFMGSMTGGVGLAETYRQALQNAGRSAEEKLPADPNTQLFGPVRIQKAAKEGLTQDIDTPLGKFMADMGLSTVSLLGSTLFGGGIASRAIMGSNAGGTAAYDAMKRGATPEQAAAVGTVAALATAALRSLSVNSITDLAGDGVRQSFGQAILRMGAKEGIVRGAADYINLLGDNLIMGDKSEMKQYEKALEEQGLSEEEANKKAVFEFAVLRPALSAAGGFVSGAAMSAGGQILPPLVRGIKGAIDERMKDPGYIEGTGRWVDSEDYEDPLYLLAGAVAEEKGVSPEEALMLVQSINDAAGGAGEGTGGPVAGGTSDYFGNDMPEEPETTPADRISEIDKKINETPVRMVQSEGNEPETDENAINEIADAVSRETGLSEEEARTMVNEAYSRQNGAGADTEENSLVSETGENLTETGDKRIWEKAAEDQAEYDRQYAEKYGNGNVPQEKNNPLAQAEEPEEGNNPLANTQAQEETAADKKRADRRAWFEAEEKKRQHEIVKKEVVQNTLNKVHESFRRYAGTDVDAAVESWINQEIEERGVPEAFEDDLNQYSSYMAWQLEQRAKRNYSYMRGGTVEYRMKKALTQALNELRGSIQPNEERAARNLSEKPEPRVNINKYLKENPESVNEYVSGNYSRDVDGIWGNQIRTDTEKRNAIIDDGTRAQYAKQALQGVEDIIRKSEPFRKENALTSAEKKTVERLNDEILNVSGLNDEGIRADVVDNVINQIERGEPVIVFPKRTDSPVPPSVTITPNVNRAVIAQYLPYLVEYDATTTKYTRESGNLKTAAEVRAYQDAQLLDSAKDLKTPIQYYLLPPERVFENILKEYPETARHLYDTYLGDIRTDNASATRLKNFLFGEMDKWGIETGKKHLYHLEFENRDGTPIIGDFNENGVLQVYGEGLIDDAELESLTDKKGAPIDAEKIRGAKGAITEFYKKLLDSINAVMIEMGYDPVLERQNYFPHYNEEEAGFWQNMLNLAGFESSVAEIPTAVAGRTEKFKPGKQYFGNILQRKGDGTAYDAIGGFQKYVNIAANIIYLTRDIQNLRALGEAARKRYGGEVFNSAIRDIGESRLRGAITPEEYYSRKGDLEEARDRSLTKMTNLVKWIDEEANILSGKQSFMDRAIENALGRVSLKWAENIMSRFSGNVIGGNASSATTNFIPFFQDDTKVQYKLRALKDVVQNGFNRDDFIDRSDFLTNRYGAKPLVMTRMQNVREKGYFLMETIDHITARSLVRARYYQNIAAGMNEDQAMAEADEHVARVMADRTRGTMPTFFSAKNPFIRALTMFQLEQLNQMERAFMDIPKEYGKAGAGAIAAQLFGMMLGAFLYNEATEKLTGRRAATDPANMVWETINDFKERKRANLLDVLFKDEDLYSPMEISDDQKIKNLKQRIGREIPIAGSFFGGGRIPIADAMPDWDTLGKNWESKGESKKAASKVMQEIMKPVVYFGSPVGYGVQARKTYEGLSEMIKGGSYVYDKNDKEQLRYPVDNSNPYDVVRNAVFGRTAAKEYQNWKRRGYQNLTADETEAYRKIVQNGNMSYDQFMSGIYAMKNGGTKKAEKARALYDLEGLSPKQKQELWEATTKYSTKPEYVPDFKQNKKDFYKKWEVTAE